MLVGALTSHIARLTASVDTAGLDGELLVRTVDSKVKALAVVVGVRVGGATGSIIILIVLAGSIGSSSHLGCCVAGAAASGGGLTGLDGAGNGYTDKSSERGEGL